MTYTTRVRYIYGCCVSSQKKKKFFFLSSRFRFALNNNNIFSISIIITSKVVEIVLL